MIQAQLFLIDRINANFDCREKKEFDQAIRCISKYIHEYPTDSRSWIELCLCLKRSKRVDLALLIGQMTFKIDTQANLVNKYDLLLCYHIF